MNILFKYCSDVGLILDSQEIKDNMTRMHRMEISMIQNVLELNYQRINYIKNFILLDLLMIDF